MNHTMTTDHDNHGGGGGGGERDLHVGHDGVMVRVTAQPSTRATEGRNRAATLATADTPVMRITSGCSVGGSGGACCSPFPSC